MNPKTKVFSAAAAAVLVSALVFASFAVAKSYAQDGNQTGTATGNQTTTTTPSPAGGNQTSATGNQTGSTTGNQTGTAAGNNQTGVTTGNQTGTVPGNQTATTTTVDRLTGRIASIQIEDGKPAWIQAGIWLLRTNENGGSAATGNETATTGNATSATGNNATSATGGGGGGGGITAGNTNLFFIARFEMVQPNGTAAHEHNVTDLKASDVTLENNTLTINGTATVTLKGGPVEDVPVTIRILDNTVLALTIGPDKVDNHFGADPIYGTVATGRR
ncbi:hypothetical protein [Nitrososphaera viennensis]|nr:hypothetical protein [Nitrososphaera viennensis]UVS68788.1 hypothetical protein NWT39_12885 [Nitrososphaera viennensis]